MSRKNRSERGIASLEYGITIGAVTLVLAAMFAQTSSGIQGVWKQAAVATAQSPAAHTSTVGSLSIDCMAGAHGNSKACSNPGF